MGANQSAGYPGAVSSTARRKNAKRLLQAVKDIVVRHEGKSEQEKRSLLIKIGQLLKAGAHSKVQDSEGRTCLHYIAAYWTDDLDEIIRSVHGHGSQNFVPVHFSRYFIARADVNKRDKGGKTSLYWAAHGGHPEIARLLLAAGAKPDLPDNKGRTPLLLATRKRNEIQYLQVLKILIGAGANIQATNKGKALLQRAYQSNDTKLVNLLLARGASLNAVDQNGSNALLHAVRSNNMKTLRKIIGEGADINFINTKGVGKDPSAPMTALHIVIMSNNVAMLKYLLELGADPNRTNKIGRSILSFAAEARPKIKKRPTKDLTLEMMELLLSHGADLYDGGLGYPESPFESLVSRNRVAEVELLFKYGLDISRYSPRTPSDFSPLHEAVRCSLGTGGCTMLSLMLQHDSKGLLDLEHVDALGRSPLCLAAEVGSPHSMKLLIDRGADVDHVEGTNRSPLELASALSRDDSSELECIKLLVSSGAKLRNILEELSPRNADDEAKDRLWDKAKCVIKYRVLHESQRSAVEPIENLTMPDEYRSNCKSCRAEIALLRNSHIYVHPTHFDSLMDKDFDENVEILVLMKPNGLFEFFKEEDVKIRFPLYGQDICNRFKCVIDMQSGKKL